MFLHIWYYLWVDICVFIISCSLLLLNVSLKFISSVLEVYILWLYFAVVLLIAMVTTYALLLNIRANYIHYGWHITSSLYLGITICIIPVIYYFARKYNMPGNGFSTFRELRIVIIQFVTSIVIASMIVVQSLRAISYIHAVKHINTGINGNIEYHYCAAMIFVVTFTCIILLLWYCLYRVIVTNRTLHVQ